MSYLAQYNHKQLSTDYNNFLKINTENSYTPGRRETESDIGTVTAGGTPFQDECLNGTFKSGTSYFVHFYVLRQPQDSAGTQEFSIKLTKYSDSVKNAKEQYITDIRAQQDGVTKYTAIQDGEEIDLINKKYYLYSNGKYTEIPVENENPIWYYYDNGFQPTQSKFIYRPTESSNINYYSKTTETFSNLDSTKWDPELGITPNTYIWQDIDTKKKIKITRTDENQDSIIIETYTLLNSQDTTICVAKTKANWAEYSLTFTPVDNFNCLLFTLKRTAADYRGEIRYPLILFQEISEIQNILGVVNGAPPSGLLKIGVLSHPNLKMFINNEEIHIGNTGIYELHSGKIKIDTFSILSEVIDDKIEDIQNDLYTLWVNANESGDISTATKSFSITQNDIKSNITITNDKYSYTNTRTRTIDAFTIDYMI